MTVTVPVRPVLERALELFESKPGPVEARVDRGYLNLLDEAELPRLVQRWMASRVAPPVYERLWRPFVIRVLMGRDAPGQQGEQSMASAMLRLSPGDRVLDIACGTGAFSRCFAEAVGDGLVVGIDISPGMMAAAARRTKSPKVVYMRADATALPFSDGSFEAVCCFGALHLFEDPMRGLDEIARVLAPGGRVALMVTCEPSGSESGGLRRRYGGIVFFRPGEVEDALTARGFAEVERRVAGKAQFISALKRA